MTEAEMRAAIAKAVNGKIEGFVMGGPTNMSADVPPITINDVRQVAERMRLSLAFCRLQSQLDALAVLTISRWPRDDRPLYSPR